MGAAMVSKGVKERAFKRLLGLRVAELRRARKFSQAELRRRSGLSVEYISRIENGRENPTILTLRDLVRNGLQVKLGDFFKRLT
mgnify:CR=1 FL=1